MVSVQNRRKCICFSGLATEDGLRIASKEKPAYIWQMLRKYSYLVDARFDNARNVDV